MDLLYSGSVKNVYQDADPQQVWFEYTDDYSVFDWGKMPDRIPGKGEALARLGEFFFRELENPARWRELDLAERPDVAPLLPIRHHFLRRQGNRLLMQRVHVPRLPTAQVGGTLVYDYSYAPQPRELLPLEVIFRFGVPAGSSLLSRKDWYPFPIHEGAEFAQPLIEFSTKLESKDRMLSYQETALILKGRAQLLAQMHGRTQAIALFLHKLFAARGLKLWDGKLEWALMDGQLCLVDSIGPDELRVSLGQAVLSKQFLRDFYLGSPWEQAVVRAKDLAKARATRDWKPIVKDELRQTPPPLPPAYLAAAQALYQDFAAMVVEGQPRETFVNALKAL
ncbi:MAG TPA: phosphoribosylaminoimidazolesuccinocarboxamide synthase [bacterium]|nr:phosphoribosylaminoimidazolesuccinocarboxamide synthase [bacterium]